MAVHSAAISGNEDIVRIILEPDRMVDLNTPTFDTKENLAQLAVKHGHRNLKRCWPNVDLLKDLLKSQGLEDDADDNLGQISLLGDTLENTTAMFARLRDPNIPARDKSGDIQRACTLIKTLKGVAELSSHPSRLHSTDRRFRAMVVSEVLQVIHMMQKLFRVDHAAIADPDLSPVRTLWKQLAFTSFVVGTAQLCVSVDRKPQAREILNVLEKRLVKMPFDKREPGGFRELVQTYSFARDGMGMGRTSSPDTFRALEWYLNSTWTTMSSR
ncbi:unnamed protein product [Phytophthora lilii]|uniref:Unnamed protein product n=1 Tax=Phytophthora lilii TaxID=2077276 RepID=A0A9W6TI50_9STRA|nr:unnamed protein product [Phytophthora lilii]